MHTADLRVLGDTAALTVTAAHDVAEVLTTAVRANGGASIALAGGRMPRDLYRCLAVDHCRDTPWKDVHVYWGDERQVSHEDERSNYYMARESLLDHVPVHPRSVNPMATSLADPSQAAADCDRTLRARFDSEWRRFDVVLLGIGEDGHTASLFPESPALGETTRWVGGTGLKAGILDLDGRMVSDRVRVPTPAHCPPAVLVRAMTDLVAPLGASDRVSVGFPGCWRCSGHRWRFPFGLKSPMDYPVFSASAAAALLAQRAFRQHRQQSSPNRM